MQLEPREFFTIVRQLADHTDNTTYFVRTIVRNARTDALIDTVDLTDQGGGSQRFSKEYEVPADTSGLGFWIIITSSVYTDSNFTTKSDNYGDEANIYNVIARQKMGGGHSVFTDFKKIEEILSVGLSGQLKKMPPADKTNHEALISGAVTEITKQIELNRIEIPPSTPTDLAPVIREIVATQKTIIEAIADKKVTEKTDLTPVLEAVKEIRVSLDSADVEGALVSIRELEKTVEEGIPAMQKLIEDSMGKLKELFAVAFNVMQHTKSSGGKKVDNLFKLPRK